MRFYWLVYRFYSCRLLVICTIIIVGLAYVHSFIIREIEAVRVVVFHVNNIYLIIGLFDRWLTRSELYFGDRALLFLLSLRNTNYGVYKFMSVVYALLKTAVFIIGFTLILFKILIILWPSCIQERIVRSSATNPLASYLTHLK